MSRSLLARIEALEREAQRSSEPPLYIVIRRFSGGDELKGYSWGSGHTLRKPGESDSDLLGRAEQESLPALQSSYIEGIILLTEIKGAH